MARALIDTYSLTELDDYIKNTLMGYKPEVGAAAYLIENMILCESLLVDEKKVNGWEVNKTCQMFRDVFEYLDPPVSNGALTALRSSSDSHHPAALPGVDNLLVRTHYYAELASSLDAYFCPHPVRMAYIKESFKGQNRKPIAQIAVRELDKRLENQKAAQIAEVDFSVPPVVDLVLSLAQKTDVVTAITDVRNSRNAVAFRRWCHELDNEIRYCTGRTSTATIQKVLAEIDTVAKEWESNLDHGVKSIRRRISLKKIWVIGSILEALGKSEIEVNDPVLRARKRHLLFLNDLYRTPK